MRKPKKAAPAIHPTPPIPTPGIKYNFITSKETRLLVSDYAQIIDRLAQGNGSISVADINQILISAERIIFLVKQQ